MKKANHNASNQTCGICCIRRLVCPVVFILICLFEINTLGAIAANPALTQIAHSICKDAGTPITVTPEAKIGPLYVFEENHASLKGQMQIATMLTRLYKQEGLSIVGLEGSMSGGKPLPTRSFLPGKSALARRDALRRLLLDGDLRATEYVAAVNPAIELWGLEKAEEYNVQPPEGISPSFLAVLAISEKLLPEDKLLEVVNLFKAQKVTQAIDVMKSNDPWIREQLSRTNEDSVDLQDQIRHEQDILRKAQQLGVRLPSRVRNGMDQTIRFYQVAEIRSVTIASNMMVLARAHAGRPTALVVGSAHADRVMNIFAANDVSAVLIKPLNFQSSTNDHGLAAFENKNAGRLANDDANTFDSILNKTFSSKQGGPAQHPPPTFIGNSNPSREALGSIQYATSVIAAAARAGRKLPQDVPEILHQLPGGINIDATSFSQYGYDVVFRVVLTRPDNSEQQIWVRAGTVTQVSSKSKDKDLELLTAADNEPPKEPPTDERPAKNASDDSNDGKDETGKNDKDVESGKEVHVLMDAAVEYKAFTNREEAKACPQLSVQ